MRLLSVCLYLVGLLGVIINRRDILKMIMSVELMLIGVTLNLLVSILVLDDVVGEIYGLIILTVAASESAIGLGLIIVYFKIRRSIEVSSLNMLHG